MLIIPTAPLAAGPWEFRHATTLRLFSLVALACSAPIACDAWTRQPFSADENSSAVTVSPRAKGFVSRVRVKGVALEL